MRPDTPVGNLLNQIEELSALNAELLSAAKKALVRFNVLVFQFNNLPDDDLAADALTTAIARAEGRK